MSRQLVRGSLAAVILVSAIAGIAVWYEPPDPLSRANEFDRKAPSTPAAVSGTVRFAGQLVYSVSLTQDTEVRRSTVTYPNVTLETYNDRSSNRSYLRIDAETVGEFETSIELYSDAVDESVVRRENGSLEAVIVDRETDRDAARQPPPLPADLLATPRYSRDGTTTVHGRRVRVYRPRNGWYDEPGRFLRSDTVRVSGASGVMFVDPATHRLVYSNVSYRSTPASTWGTYLYRRLVGESDRTEVDYRYRWGSATVRRPSWVPDT